jgi:polypeptide N-acetylgalactosaminyltransferase
MKSCSYGMVRKHEKCLAKSNYFCHLQGENYELSLKLWLCGGELLEVPCSRVAHIFRVKNRFRKLENVDFEARNFKRVAEVWLGSYWKQFLYRTNLSRFDAVDPGDLTKQMEIRDRLNCKKFDYFIHYVAPEMTLAFSTPRDDDLAYGTLSVSDGNTTLCLSDNNAKRLTCDLQFCDKKSVTPQRAQYFHYSSQKGVQHDRAEMCFERKKFKIYNRYVFRKNFWTYNFDTKQIKLNNTNLCVNFDFAKEKLRLTKCNASNSRQKWTFGFVNATKLAND